MLLPESMTKILIVGPKDRLEETIDFLYRMESTHLIDFEEGEEGIGLGSPLPSASPTSQKLLKLRAIEKDLEVKEEKPVETVPVDRIRRELDSALASLEMETAGAVDSKNKIQQRLGELEARRRELEPFVQISLDLEMYRGYDSLAVFVGQVKMDPEGALREALEEFELFRGSSGRYLALFVSKEHAEEAQRVLVQHGFSEVPIPKESGPPDRLMKDIEEEEGALRESLQEVSSRLAALREKHAYFILAAEEELSIEVQKAETPLRMGTTAHAFVMDAWVPTTKLPELKSGIETELAETIHLEALCTRDRREHEPADESRESEEEEAPVKLKNSRPVRLFEYLIELISVPKYNEIDPTALVSLFFPMFFGLMVGDVGYAIPFLILGYLGLKKCTSDEWRTIATMLFFGGIFSFIFGLFLYGEALGLHFAPRPGEDTWSSLLGVDLPHEISLGAFSIPLGVISKLHDVKLLLYIGIWIGVAHLMLGLIIGLVNVGMRHGLKHALLEKLGWILILVGGALLIPLMVDVMIWGAPLDLTGMGFILPLVIIIAGVAVQVKGEGMTAILELPGLVSNILSYSRLAAVALSKAGMAFAFNTIAIGLIAPMGGIAIVAALVVFIVGHMTVWIIAIISCGLHSIRLQYVEFFTKFFTGDGLKFNPLRIVRKYTEV